ncbi:MAG: hypothetical protein ACR65R_04450 [Methylomicrobium sp.]
MLKIALLFMVLSLPVWAEESSSAEQSTNFCLDPKAAQNNEELARKNPRDETLIKLVAMRVGFSASLHHPGFIILPKIRSNRLNLVAF